MARKIQDIVRGQKLQVLAENATVEQACQCMTEHGVGSVVVVDEHQRLTGIFTGRDAVRLLAQGESAERTPLSKAMTHNPVTISPDNHAIDALRKMNDLGFRHLPVVDGEKIVGIITRSFFTGDEIEQLDGEIHLWECIL
jgi:CBS domain-containing protein